MSFNINGPSNIPSIQEPQSMMNNGGGGNLGYFMRDDSDAIIKFGDDGEEDSFEKSVDESFDTELSFNLFTKISAFLKKLWKNIVKFFTPEIKKTNDEFIKK